jgi:carbonic anhydrase
MSELSDIRAANEAYASTFAHAGLAPHPARKLAVVTCMDARLDPAKFLGLSEGDAHVIRNAGGLVTDDALRSLIISYWGLGTREVVVIAHENCGMQTFTNEDIHARLEQETGHDATGIDFLPFAGLDDAVRGSIRRIRECPFLPDDYRATGFVYDVQTGALREVSAE